MRFSYLENWTNKENYESVKFAQKQAWVSIIELLLRSFRLTESFFLPMEAGIKGNIFFFIHFFGPISSEVVSLDPFQTTFWRQENRILDESFIGELQEESSGVSSVSSGTCENLNFQLTTPSCMLTRSVAAKTRDMASLIRKHDEGSQTEVKLINTCRRV